MCIHKLEQSISVRTATELIVWEACQWLDNVDMLTYATFDQNITCGSRVMGIFTNC